MYNLLCPRRRYSIFLTPIQTKKSAKKWRISEQQFKEKLLIGKGREAS